MAHNLIASLPELDDFSQSDESDGDTIFERAGGWDAFESRSRPGSAASTRPDSPIRRLESHNPSTSDVGAETKDRAAGSSSLSSAALVSVVSADLSSTSVQEPQSIVSFDTALSNYLAVSKKDDSSHRAVTSSYAAHAEERSVHESKLKLKLPRAFPSEISSSSANTPVTTLSPPPSPVRSTLHHRSVQHDLSARPKHVPKFQSNATLTVPLRDFRQILSDDSSTKADKGSEPSTKKAVKPMPPKAVKRLKSKRKHRVSKTKAVPSRQEPCKVKPYSEDETNRGVPDSVSSPSSSWSFDKNHAESLTSKSNQTKSTNVPSSHGLDDRMKVTRDIVELGLIAFHNKSSFGNPICASVNVPGSKTVITISLARLSFAQFGALLEMLLSWVPGTTEPDSSQKAPVTICSLAVVPEWRHQVLQAVVKFSGHVNNALNSLENTEICTVHGEAVKIGDVADCKAGLPGVSADGLGEPSSVWHTNAPDTLDETIPIQNAELARQTTVMLVPCTVLEQKGALSQVLIRAEAEHFAIAGLRLIFPTVDQLQDAGTNDFLLGNIGSSEAYVAIALRGSDSHVIERWCEIVGPVDPMIARKTDPESLRALFGVDKNDRFVYCARNLEQSMEQTAKWFGKRYDISPRDHNSTPRNSVVSNRGRQYLSILPIETAVIFLKKSSSIKCFPDMLNIFKKFGFAVLGNTRCKLSPNNLARLARSRSHSGSKSTSTWDGYIWKVSKEDAIHSAKVLQQDERHVLKKIGIDTEQMFVTELAALESIQNDAEQPLRIDETPSADLISRRMEKRSKTLQHWERSIPFAVVVSIMPNCFVKCGGWLHSVLAKELVNGKHQGRPGLRLVASKWLPQVRSHQAKELTPFEVGDAEYRASLAKLQKGSVQLLVLHGFDAFKRTMMAIKEMKLTSQEIFVSPTAALVWRQLATFFFDREIYISENMNGPKLAPLDMSIRPLILNLTLTPSPIKTLGTINGSWSSIKISNVLRAARRSGLKIVKLKYGCFNKNTQEVQFGDGQGDPTTNEYLDPVWILALEHPNAVALWLDIVDRFDADLERKSLFGSESFKSAKIDCENVFLMQTSPISSPINHRSTAFLLERNCIFLTPSLLGRIPFDEIYDFIIEQGFLVVACSSYDMDSELAQQYLYHNQDLGQRLHPVLSQGQAIILGVERDNAVTCVKSLLHRPPFAQEFSRTLLASSFANAV